jgi:YgiT-type zinc finger domain-containing protein
MGVNVFKKPIIMKCVICKQGETQPGTAIVTLTRETLTLVVRDVPAQVCENCGEEYVDEELLLGCPKWLRKRQRYGLPRPLLLLCIYKTSILVDRPAWNLDELIRL